MSEALTEAIAQSERIARRLADERGSFVEFVIDLADFAAHRRYEVLGYATLWDYCVGHLKLSAGQAFYRTNAAYVVQKAPIAVEYLRDGRMCMTTLHELVDVIDDSNARELLDLASWKTRTEVKEIVVARKPHVDAAKASGEVRKVPTRDGEVRTAPAAVAVDMQPGTALFAPPAVEEPKPRVEPLAEDRYSLPLRFGRVFKEKLDAAKVALGHVVPDGDPAKILERGLDLILEKEAKRHAPPKKDTRAAKPGKARPYIPVDLARAVRRRDQGSCTWTLANGTRCGSKRQLQIDHVTAVALGGATELSNLRLLCAAHNRLHARQTFGGPFVERKIAARREAREGPE